MRFLLKFLVIISFLASCKPSQQPAQEIKPASGIVLPNTYERMVKFERYGEHYEGKLVFVPYELSYLPAAHQTSCYLVEGSFTTWVGGSLEGSLPMGIYNVSISPDSKYIAFEVSGEGHPWVEIAELQHLISENKYEPFADIQPYPGYIEVVGWEGKEMIFKSDLPFDRKMAGDSTITYEDLPEKPYTFHFHLETHQIRKVGE